MLTAIGNTPLVKLKLNEQSKSEVFAKLELLNPFGMKDRVAKNIILRAKEKGILRPSEPIIESSSGTMACGVALVGKALGHEVHIVTDPRIDEITYAKLSSLGCKVHIVKEMNTKGWQGARLKKLYSLLEEYPTAFWLRQYDNPDNPLAYHDLVEEVMRELNGVDILVASVGSGGSISGTAKALKKYNKNLKVVAVDATGSVIFGQPDRPERLQSGIGNSLVAKNVDFAVIDEVHWLNDEESFLATLQLAKEEQIFAGNSSGSVYAVARWLSTQMDSGMKILSIFPDRGDRYFNTIYHKSFRTEKGIRDEKGLRSPVRIPRSSIATSWSYTSLRGMDDHKTEKTTAY
ncbi:cysteine synthase family protein [Kroppenstedtia pulmonis]|uniref:Cysteine synthase family protein n=1 Tax=Kroppenstedtia pulmonis TaxID=1380685 RepID=A0A7D3Y776_9BACL|nr:cysteine synthase family protein [Kroppenstedtia pulmonis]QKG85985.1 cysteine synthase family protein [Kroppenstedtia pulmonis]